MNDKLRIIELEKQLITYEAMIERRSQEINALLTAPSLFLRVMTISPEYVTRFGGRQTEEGVVLAYKRERKEFEEAARDCLRENTQASRTHLAGEAIDVMVTMGGILHFFGVTPQEIEGAAYQTLDKLTGRTHDTHAWDEDSKTVMSRIKIAQKGETK